MKRRELQYHEAINIKAGRQPRPRWSPAPATPQIPRRGLGDFLHPTLLWIARHARMKCVDPRTGQLRGGSKCGGRRAQLNAWGWKVTGKRFWKSL